MRKSWPLVFLALLLATLSIGSAWADPPASLTPPRRLQFGVLSYNIKGLPGFAAPGYDEDRYGDIGRLLAERNLGGRGPDIVALQESFVARTAELRALAGFAHSAKGPDAATLWGVDSGLWILSRYPILKEERLAFGPKLCATWDCYANKGVQLARIQLPGAPYPVDVYNTHMQAGREHDEIRRAQVKVILEFVKKTHQPGAPIVFAGDFNFRPGRGDKSFEDFLRGSALTHAGKLFLRLRAPAAALPDAARLFESSVDHQFIDTAAALPFRLKPLNAERSFTALVKGRALSDHPGYEVRYELDYGPAIPAPPAARL